MAKIEEVNEIRTATEELDELVRPSSRPILASEIAKAQKEAAEAKEARKLPTPPSARPNWDDFYAWTKLLDREKHWSHLMCYLYRLTPVIDRKRVNPDSPKYIDVLSEPFDLDYLIHKHGGGLYNLTCTDTDGKKGNQTVVDVKINISQTKYDPILDVNELVIEHRDNISFCNSLRARGILNERNQVMSANPVPATTPDVVGVVKEVAAIFRTMTLDQQDRVKSKMGMESGDGVGKEFSNLLLEHMKQQDPSKQIATMVTLMQAMKEGTQSSGSNMEMMMKLMDIQSKNNEMMINLILKTVESNKREDTTPSTDPFTLLEKMFDLQERLGGMGGTKPKQDWVEKLIDAGERVGVPLIGHILQGFMLKNKGTGGVSNTGGVQDSNGMNPPDPTNTAGVPSIAAALPPGVTGTPDTGELRQFLAQYGQMIVAKMADQPGWEFAQNLISMYGVPTHATIAKYGTDTILATFASMNELAITIPSLGGVDRVKQWIDDFINHEQAAARDEAAEEGEVEEGVDGKSEIKFKRFN